MYRFVPVDVNRIPYSTSTWDLNITCEMWILLSKSDSI